MQMKWVSKIRTLGAVSSDLKSLIDTEHLTKK